MRQASRGGFPPEGGAFVGVPSRCRGPYVLNRVSGMANSVFFVGVGLYPGFGFLGFASVVVDIGVVSGCFEFGSAWAWGWVIGVGV